MIATRAASRSRRNGASAPAPTIKAAAAASDVVFTSLPDDRALRAAILGENGLLTAMREGAVLAETSTVSPDASAEVAQACEARGIAYLRLPISGSSALAETGMVSCFASGPRGAFDASSLCCRASPVRRPISARRGGALRQARHQPDDRGERRDAGGMPRARRKEARSPGRASANTVGESAAASPFVKYKLGPLAARDFRRPFRASN